MQKKNLEYSLTSAEVNYLLNVLGKTQVNGVQAAKELVFMTERLQKPKNSDELEKEEYEKLKTKFDKEKKAK